MQRRNYFRIVAYVVVMSLFSTAHSGSYEDFFQALIRDNAGGVQGWLAQGIDPNMRNQRGQPALTLALKEGAYASAKVLLASPAIDLEVPNAAGETALMIAALKGNLEWTRMLIGRGAQVNRSGWSALHYAATGQEVAVTTFLLDHGADINARSPNGTTPLMMAAQYGGPTMAELLIARGADPRLRNERDLAAADFARTGGFDRLAATLERLVH